MAPLPVVRSRPSERGDGGRRYQLLAHRCRQRAAADCLVPPLASGTPEPSQRLLDQLIETAPLIGGQRSAGACSVPAGGLDGPGLHAS